MKESFGFEAPKRKQEPKPEEIAPILEALEREKAARGLDAAVATGNPEDIRGVLEHIKPPNLDQIEH